MTQKFFSRIIKIGGTALITIFSIMFVLGFITGETDLMSELYKKMGTMAEIAAIAAFALWVIRLAFIELKKRKFTYVKWIQLGFKLLKEHHMIIGWVAFSAALAHGSYFFLQTSEEAESIYSGLATLIGFAILVSFGLILNKWGKGKKYLRFKKIHQAIAVVFGIALGIHLLFG
ncbi:hypothetical protein V7654_03885 [Bacillus sp. JJ1609]|uniref:hypothetical protein n=1 Tax=Bacillus sp. JJ1609 TaxID=3122977 RepID=UPI002FFEFC96